MKKLLSWMMLVDDAVCPSQCMFSITIAFWGVAVNSVVFVFQAHGVMYLFKFWYMLFK
jgi:hypothetical protein